MNETNRSATEIFGILLAAGESSRMGKMKQLLDYKGRSFTYNALDGFIHAGIKTIIVVLGHEYDLMKRHINEYRPPECLKPHNYEIITARNEIYKAGQFSSIKCGISTFLQKKSIDFYAGFMLQLIDRPLVTLETFKAVKDGFDTDRGRIVIPSYNMRRGHPACFPKKVMGDVLKLDANTGSLKDILNSNSSIITHINVHDEGIIRNIDTIEEYEKIKF
ncbi:MAG: nucleotidyltransferase family protein [Candidatus Wallbacteria bacterium]